jgi:hypothetical protein
VVGTSGGTQVEAVNLDNIQQDVDSTVGGLPDYGIIIFSSDALVLTNFDIIHANVAAIAAIPTTGSSVDDTEISNGFADTSNISLLLSPSGTGNVARVWGTNDWWGDASYAGADLENGGTGISQGFVCTNCHLDNNTNAVGLLVNSSAWTNVDINGGSCFGGNRVGVALAYGAGNVALKGDTFGSCDNLLANSNADISLTAGPSDYLEIENNKFLSSTTIAGAGAVTGTHNLILNNIGYNPVGVSSPAVTSGATYTNGASPETCYLRASTSVTGVYIPAFPGTNIVGAGVAGIPVTFDLGPNETWEPTFTGTGTLVCSVH